MWGITTKKKDIQKIANPSNKAQTRSNSLFLSHLKNHSTKTHSSTSHLYKHLLHNHIQVYARYLNGAWEIHEQNTTSFEGETTKKGTSGGGTPPKSYHKCTTTSFTHCHNHLSHTFLLISLTTLSAYWFSHTMHPKTHSLPFPARETSND